jgi:hypothetical protein
VYAIVLATYLVTVQEAEDNMNVIHTFAPIKIEELKKYFEDKSTVFIIDYTNSTIKAEKLLTYISNLDIPCDIKLNSSAEVQELVTCYLNSSFIVSIPSLEEIVISLLNQHKGLAEIQDSELLTVLKPQLDSWTSKLESLALFNMYTIDDEDMKKWVTAEHKIDNTTSLEGVNFVSLLKNQDFYEFYEKMITEPKYYSGYFNEYMYKGKNLYSYWANENNPMFLLTFAIANNNLDIEQYIQCSKNSTKVLA